MSWANAGAVARKDLRRLRRDPMSLLIWLGIPLAIGVSITVATGGREGPEPKVLVWVVDRDDGLLSGLLVAALSNAGPMQAEEVANEALGRDRLMSGEGSALLVIPQGFGDAVLREDPTELRLITNPSQRILPGIAEESLDLFTEAVFYLHRLVGEDLRAQLRAVGDRESGPADLEVASLSVAMNQMVRDLEDLLFPPIIDVEVGSAEFFAAQSMGANSEGAEPAEGTQLAAPDEPSFSLLFLPGILLMAVLFVAQGLAEDTWREREAGTLRRALLSPLGAPGLLLGKSLASAAVMAMVAAVVLAAGFAYHRIAWAAFPLCVAWVILSGAAAFLGFAFLSTCASSRRGSSILGNVVLFPLLMIGGSFFPFEAMPEGMATIGRFTPNGYCIEQLKGMMLRRLDAGQVVGSFAVILVGVVTLGWVAARRLPPFARGGA